MRHGLALRALTPALFLVLGAASASTHEAFTPCPDPPCAPPAAITRTDILNEGFEGSFPPAGWAVIQLGSSTTWERNDSYMHSGAFSVCVKHGPAGVVQDEVLVTPAMDFSTLASAYLEFYEFQQFWPGFGERHSIAVSTTSQTDPAAFTTLVDWTPADHTIAGFSGEPVTLALNAYAGEPAIYLAFRYQGTNADDWYLDDVRVYTPFDHDLVLRALTPDGLQFAGGEALEPSVQVENRGNLAEDFVLQLSIEESGTPVYGESQALHLEPAEILAVDFPDLFAGAGNYYRLHAEAQLPADESPADNSRAAFCDSYTRPHVPLGWFQTNAGCGPCAAPEWAFDGWLPGQGAEVALVRCHTWWPDSLDILYQQNAAQNRELILSSGAPYFTPHFWIDGVVDLREEASLYNEGMEARKQVLSPGAIDLNWRPADSTLVACLDLDEPLDPAGDYRLQVAVTEDSVYYAGANGHSWHGQGLRRVFPLDLSGIPVSPAVGLQSFSVPLELASEWQSARLNATAFLQEQASRRIWQASTGRLSALTGRLSIDPAVRTLNVAEVCSLRVMIAPSPVPVKGVEVVIDYDESVVELQAIHEGSWISGSGLQRYFYEYANGGSAHFTMAFLDGTRQEGGELALLEFKGLAEGATPLVFTLEKVRDANNTELGYTTSTGDSLTVTEDLTPVAETTVAPATLRLLGNRPNPFNPSTLIAYELPAAGRWQVTLYDAQGRRLRTLADGWQLAGRQELRWDGRSEHGAALGSGLYFVRVSGPAGSVSGKLLLLK
jgi:hypothetical protein